MAPLPRCHVVEETEQRVLFSLSVLEMVAAAQQCLLTDCHHRWNLMNYQEEAACVLIGAVAVRARGGTVVCPGTLPESRLSAEVAESALEDLLF